MDVKLIVIDGKASKGSISLKLPTVIGRSREADLTVSHPMISRRHCEIFDDEGLLRIRDLGSLNGTVVGGQRVSEAALRPDDRFTIGPLTFRAEYRYDGPLEEVPAPTLDQRAAQPRDTAEAATPELNGLDETPKFSCAQAPDGPSEAQLPSTADFEKLAAAEASFDPDDKAGNVEEDAVDFEQFEEVGSREAENEEEEPQPSPPPPLREKPSPAPPRKQGPWSTGEQSPDEPQNQRETAPVRPNRVDAKKPAAKQFPVVNSDANQPSSADDDDGLDAFLQGLQED